MPTIGLRDLHFAKFKDDGTYETPVKLSEAISATVTPNYTVTTLYADDRAVNVASALGDIDVQINPKDLPADEYDLLMGTSKNTDGVIEDSVDDVAPYGALLFRLPFEQGGFRYYCYYKGKFQPPALTHNTRGGSTEFQTPTISGKFMPRDDGKWRAHLDAPGKVENPIADIWFDSVYKPTPPAPETTP
ncbi:major tail protein [Bacillus capparidis]|uniref:Phi13 family phage major tail protein n=1 Tax=Bacillus capparidis TaxID=1840411 RepID=A0ABS4D1K4_9BACI|nr:major tail protein [Bacillus capparidis]MBP1083505.1 phi13 family phage major tail protein [Bacillus capparidis]MED1094704.1 phage tail protein [Bacillus capparidis]